MILITPGVGCPDQELDEQLVTQMLGWGRVWPLSSGPLPS